MLFRGAEFVRFTCVLSESLYNGREHIATSCRESGFVIRSAYSRTLGTIYDVRVVHMSESEYFRTAFLSPSSDENSTGAVRISTASPSAPRKNSTAIFFN